MFHCISWTSNKDPIHESELVNMSKTEFKKMVKTKIKDSSADQQR